MQLIINFKLQLASVFQRYSKCIFVKIRVYSPKQIMARTSAKAKKQKQDVNKSKSLTENEQDSKPTNEDENTNDSADKENDGSNYEVEKIIHSRFYRGKRQYLVRWKGYKEDSDTWENESILQSCGEALEVFKKENPTTSDADNEAEDEGSVESDESDKKEKTNKRKSKKSLPKTKPSKAKKGNNDSMKDTEDDVQEETDEAKIKKEIKKGSKKIVDKQFSESETQEKESNEKKAKSNKKSVKRGKGTAEKKSKQEPSNKKAKTSEDSDDDSVTDGKDYEVEKIIEMHTRKDGTHEFLIRWKGFKPSEDTWEPEAHLDCQDLIEKFMDKVNKAKSIPSRELRESRTPVNRMIHHNRQGNLRNTGYRPSYQE